MKSPLIQHFDPQGERMTHEEWLVMFADMAQRVVEKTVIGAVEVSTVWLGLDHGFGVGPPLIFETMIFGGHLDQHQQRYSTKAEAQAGHARAVEAVKTERSEV